MKVTQEISIPVEGASLEAYLTVPQQAKGVVLFAHGSGSSRKSPRNQLVARFLHDEQIGSILMDLLTAEEDSDPDKRFDIPFLAKRLLEVTRWALREPQLHAQTLGYFGASTGAAAAVIAAAELGPKIAAVVSRGGRPDLAREALRKVQSPTLLIVGGDDVAVLDLNEQAYAMLNCTKQLQVVPGATHLFEEPGTLEEVGRMSAHWFAQYL